MGRLDETAGGPLDGASVRQWRDRSGVPVLELHGEFDLTTMGLLETELAPLLAEQPERLVFELGDLQFMDSSALAWLLRAVHEAGEVELRSLPPILRQVLEATGVIQLFRVES